MFHIIFQAGGHTLLSGLFHLRHLLSHRLPQGSSHGQPTGRLAREGRMCAGAGIIFVRGSILNSNLKTFSVSMYHVSTVLGFCMKTYLRLIT